MIHFIKPIDLSQSVSVAVTFSSQAKLTMTLTVVHTRVITPGRLEEIAPGINWIVLFEPFPGPKVGRLTITQSLSRKLPSEAFGFKE